MKQVTADNSAIQRQTWWFQQGPAAKVFLFTMIVSLVPLLYEGYGLAMDNGTVKSCCATAAKVISG